jgi:hypothetical protein
VSPYRCTSLELCQRFSSSPERVAILRGFLAFRQQLQTLGLIEGYQWLDGSFLEDVEARESRPPNDIDILTLYWGYDIPFQQTVIQQLPEFRDRKLAKKNYKVDHFGLDVGHSPQSTVELLRYWLQLFTHNRDAVWKGMLRVDLNTPD